MKDKTFLMIPGPTPVPESVLLAMAKHPMGHRSSEFSAILEETYADLKWLFQTQNDVFIYTSSGTGAMEAALSNLVNEGDKVLSLVIGNFGNRFAKIAKSLGADVEKIEVEPGEAINPDVLKERLDADKNKEIKIVTLTHNETSTGVISAGGSSSSSGSNSEMDLNKDGQVTSDEVIKYMQMQMMDRMSEQTCSDDGCFEMGQQASKQAASGIEEFKSKQAASAYQSVQNSVIDMITDCFMV